MPGPEGVSPFRLRKGLPGVPFRTGAGRPSRIWATGEPDRLEADPTQNAHRRYRSAHLLTTKSGDRAGAGFTGWILFLRFGAEGSFPPGAG